ncbi:MAG: type II toxin-antitoxin system VapC family toxin [Dehalococcoidia bacterium]
MHYLIDSDYVIDHLDEVPQARQLLDHLAQDGIALSIFVYMEVYQGLLRHPDPAEAKRRFASFTQTVPILPFTPAVAQRCAELRETLKRQGKRVNSRAIDVLNAGTVLAYGLVLVTRNRDDYDDIPGLRIY